MFERQSPGPGRDVNPLAWLSLAAAGAGLAIYLYSHYSASAEAIVWTLLGVVVAGFVLYHAIGEASLWWEVRQAHLESMERTDAVYQARAEVIAPKPHPLSVWRQDAIEAPPEYESTLIPLVRAEETPPPVTRITRTTTTVEFEGELSGPQMRQLMGEDDTPPHS